MGVIYTQQLKRFADGFEGKIKAIFAKKTDIPTELPANGGNANTVNGHTVAVNVPAGAKFTDTTYTAMKGASASAAGAAGLVPAPAKGKQNSFLRGDGQWAEIEEASDADIDAIIAGTFSE